MISSMRDCQRAQERELSVRFKFPGGGGGMRGGAGEMTNQRGVSEVLRQERISLAIGFRHAFSYLTTDRERKTRLFVLFWRPRFKIVE